MQRTVGQMSAQARQPSAHFSVLRHRSLPGLHYLESALAGNFTLPAANENGSSPPAWCLLLVITDDMSGAVVDDKIPHLTSRTGALNVVD
jgi:hypothetical protein